MMRQILEFFCILFYLVTIGSYVVSKNVCFEKSLKDIHSCAPSFNPRRATCNALTLDARRRELTWIRSVFGILSVYNCGLHAMALSSDKDKSASFAWDARMKITSASNEHTDHEPIRFVHARHRAVPRCRAAAVPCRRLVRLLPSHAIFIRRIQYKMSYQHLLLWQARSKVISVKILP